MYTTGDRIRDLREGKKMTQADLGRALGTTRGAVGNWERCANPAFDAIEITLGPDAEMIGRVAGRISRL